MTPGKGDVLLAEGDPDVAEDEERLVEEFRRQLDLGMWAAVPHEGPGGRREATMVRDFAEIPAGSERVIFFPQAAGGSMVDPATMHAWLTPVAVAARRPRACPCRQQGLRPASPDLLGHGRPQARSAARSTI